MKSHKLPVQKKPKNGDKLLPKGGEIMMRTAFDRNLRKKKLGGGSHNTYSGPPKKKKKWIF